MDKNHRCFLCNNTDLKVVYRLKQKNIVFCPHDDLFFAKSTMSSHKFYDSDYYAINPHPSLVKTNENYFLSKLTMIKTLTKEKSPKILDIGCGWGDFLQVLDKQHLSYLGIDTSKKAIEICLKKKLNGKQTDITHLAETNKEQFSAITCFQVIEHLPDPLPFLQQAKKLLKNDGVIVITTPNNNALSRFRQKHRWSVYNTDSHAVFYNQKNLTIVLTKAGFLKINVRADEPRFLSLGYLIMRMNELRGNSIFKFLYPLLKMLSFPMITGKFDDLEAVGIK